jgi:hypothetical protein
MDSSKGERRHRGEGVSLDRGRGVEQRREAHGILRVPRNVEERNFLDMSAK